MIALDEDALICDFAEFYQENASKICNSYFYAINYVTLNAE